MIKSLVHNSNFINHNTNLFRMNIFSYGNTLSWLEVYIQELVLLSLVCQTYSDFFNWNKVKIRYCDGASLAGHPENEVKVGFTFTSATLTYGS